MTGAQKNRIEIAALELDYARRAQTRFAVIGYMNGMGRMPVMVEVKEAEREFWRACHTLLEAKARKARSNGV